MSNPIGWTDRTVNPVIGCQNGCPYCYARRMAPRVAALAAGASGKPVCEDCRTFTPHFHPERLPQIGKGRGQVVFVGSMCDLWSEGVQPEWRRAIWDEVAAHTENQYVVLTKAFDAYALCTRDVPTEAENLWVGTSVTNDCAQAERWMNLLASSVSERRVLSVEPVLSGCTFGEWDAAAPHWVIVGPETGPGAFPPRREWIEQAIAYADSIGAPLWLKSGCYDLWPDLPVRQERPAAMVQACEAAKAHKTRRS